MNLVSFWLCEKNIPEGTIQCHKTNSNREVTEILKLNIWKFL